MKKPDNLFTSNLLSSYELTELWFGPEGEIEIPILFKVLNFTITNVVDELNYAGEVTYEIDTEYGGGPVEITTTFAIVEGKLEIEDELIDTNDLDWEYIDEQIDENYNKEKYSIKVMH